MDADPDDLNALRTAALKSIQGKKVSSKKRNKHRKVAMVAEDEDLNALRLAALMTRRQNQQITVIQKVAPTNYPPPHHRMQPNIPRYLVKPSNNLISLTPGPEQEKKTVPQPLAVRVVSTIPSKPAIPTKVPEAIKRVPDKFRRFDGDSSSDEDDLLLEEDGFMESTLDEDDDGSDKESVKSFSSVESVKIDAIDVEANFSDAEQSENEEEPAKNLSSDSSVASPPPQEESPPPDTIGTDHTTKNTDDMDTSKANETSTKQSGRQRQRSVSITEPSNAVKVKPIPQPQHKPTPINESRRSDSESDSTSSSSSDISLSSSEDEALPNKSKVMLKKSQPQVVTSRRVSVSGKDNPSSRVGVTSDLRSKLKFKKVPDDKSTKRTTTRENFTVDVNKERRIILKNKKSSEISREDETNSKPQTTVSSKRTSQSSRDVKTKTKHKNTNQRKFIDKNKTDKKSTKTVYLKTSKIKERKRQPSTSTSPTESSYTTSEDDDDEIIGASNRFTDRNRRVGDSTTSRTSAHNRRRFIKRVYDGEEDQQSISTTKPIYSRLGNTKSAKRESRDVFSRIEKNRDRRKPKRNKRVVDRNRSQDDRQGKKRRNVSISNRNQEPDSSDDILEKRIKMIKEKNARILRRQQEIEMEKKKYG